MLGPNGFFFFFFSLVDNIKYPMGITKINSLIHTLSLFFWGEGSGQNARANIAIWWMNHKSGLYGIANLSEPVSSQKRNFSYSKKKKFFFLNLGLIRPFQLDQWPIVYICVCVCFLYWCWFRVNAVILVWPTFF